MFVIAPAYWFLGDITGTYCATAYGSDKASAAEAAAEYERRKVLVEMDYKTRTAYGNREEWAVNAVQDKADADTSWNRADAGRCGLTKIGLFLGKSISYDASVNEDRNSLQRKREVDSAATFGLAYIPNAYVAVLAGFSLNTLTIAAAEADGDEPAQPERLRRFVTFTFGLGGNLDVIGTLFK